MKKLLLIALLFSLLLQKVPGIQQLLKENLTCLAADSEETPTEKSSNKTEKKEVKDLLCLDRPHYQILSKQSLSFLDTPPLLRGAPTDILTPPPDAC